MEQIHESNLSGETKKNLSKKRECLDPETRDFKT